MYTVCSSTPGKERYTEQSLKASDASSRFTVLSWYIYWAKPRNPSNPEHKVVQDTLGLIQRYHPEKLRAPEKDPWTYFKVAEARPEWLTASCDLLPVSGHTPWESLVSASFASLWPSAACANFCLNSLWICAALHHLVWTHIEADADFHAPEQISSSTDCRVFTSFIKAILPLGSCGV